MNNSAENATALAATIDTRLTIVHRNAHRYRRLHIILVLITLISGTFATVLAADAALGTRIVAPLVAAASTGEQSGDLASGWKSVSKIADNREQTCFVAPDFLCQALLGILSSGK